MGLINHTSHPHVSGSKAYNIGQKLGLWMGPHYVVAELDCSNKTPSNNNKSDSAGLSPWSSCKILATIPSRWPLSICYMHSFCITQNYFILIEQPLSIFLPTVPINHLCGEKPLASCLRYYPEEDTLFHVIPRGSSSGGRRVFRAPSFFFLHTINAFEMRDVDTNDTFVIVDICCYDDPKMIDCMYVDALKNAHKNPDYAKMFRGRPKRFLLKFSELEKVAHGKHPTAESEIIVNVGCETPRINYELYDGKPYNFFYAISSDVDADNPGMVSRSYQSNNIKYKRMTLIKLCLFQ